MTPPPPISEFQTDSNSFGVYHIYKSGKLTYTPDESFTISSVADSPNFVVHKPDNASKWSSPFRIANPFTDPASSTSTSYLPFKNLSIFCLMQWFYDASVTKSLQSLNSLVQGVLLAPGFSLEDLTGFDAAKEAKCLDAYQMADPLLGSGTNRKIDDGWIETTVPLSLPCDRVKHRSEEDAPIFNVPGLLYRKPLEVIKATFQEPAAEQLHLFPFEEYWKPAPDSPPERIHLELYNLDAFILEHEKIRSQSNPECHLEMVIAAIMVWSDSTHLTNFGNASLWPIYLYLGSLSKYFCAQPSSFAAHHLAYIPKVMCLPFIHHFCHPQLKFQLGDAIQDFYQETFGQPAMADILMHLWRDLMHAVWRLILDDEFLDAYVNGIIITFPDGIQQRLSPCFFSYSADYPEK